MAERAHIVIKGVVLRETETKESDKILTLLTAERGRLSVIARGARRKEHANSPPAPSTWPGPSGPCIRRATGTIVNEGDHPGALHWPADWTLELLALWAATLRS